MAYTTLSDISDTLKGLTLNSTTTPTSTAVSGWIDESDELIDERTGRVWSSTAVSSTFIDYDGSGSIRLEHAPLISISELKYETAGLGASDAVWSTLTEGRTNDFVTYLKEGELKFFGNTKPSAGYQNICLSYSYGHTTTPKYIKTLSSLLTAKKVIQATVNAMSQEEGGSVTVGNISITDPTNFATDHIKQMNAEIKSIWDNLGAKNRIFRNTRRY